MTKHGLGRNLSALLKPTDPDSTDSIKTLAIDALRPGKYQPRGEIQADSLTDLAQSIKQQGLLQPLVVRECSRGDYEIIAGERRWRACQLAGLKQVPVVLRQVDDETALALALIENLQREDLNALEEARAILQLSQEFHLTHQQIAELLCKSRTTVTNALRLLNLSKSVQAMLAEGQIEMGHARSLLALDEPSQLEVAKLIIAKRLSVREAEALVTRTKSAPIQKNTPSPLPPNFEGAIRTLSHRLETLVNIKHGKAGSGKLILHYNDLDALEQMIGQLMGG